MGKMLGEQTVEQMLNFRAHFFCLVLHFQDLRLDVGQPQRAILLFDLVVRVDQHAQGS